MALEIVEPVDTLQPGTMKTNKQSKPLSLGDSWARQKKEREEMRNLKARNRLFYLMAGC